MTTETVLTDEQVRNIIEDVASPNEEVFKFTVEVARAIQQAVLQSPEVQRLKAIETAAKEVLSVPREDGYVVLTVHLDALRAAMEQNQGG